MKRILVPGMLAGLINLIILMVQSYGSSLLSPVLAQQYANTQLYRPWSQPAMWVIFVYPFFQGVALAWIWDKTKVLLTGGKFTRIVKFTFSFWVVAFVPAMIMIYSCMPVSLFAISIWTVSGFVYGLVSAIVFEKYLPQQ